MFPNIPNIDTEDGYSYYEDYDGDEDSYARLHLIKAPGDEGYTFLRSNGASNWLQTDDVKYAITYHRLCGQWPSPDLLEGRVNERISRQLEGAAQ